MLVVESGMEAAVVELVLAIRCFPGLGNSRGPLGTLIFSRSVLLLFWFKLGPRSRLGRVADAGRDGLRKVMSDVVVVSVGSVVVR